jgi:hypothetical protein
MIPRQALFDAAPAAPPPPLPFDTALPDTADSPDHSSRRHDGWSAANQRRFLEAIAIGHGVEAACRCVGLSAASAYAFRRSAKGSVFALGWRAASLVAREAIAETLLGRAMEGQVDTYVRADGTQVTRHRHDNRLAMALLARLDRQVEAAPDADVKAAGRVAQEFDAFLDLVAEGEGPARAGLFLARGMGTLTEAGIEADLSPIYALATADRLIRTGVATAGEVPVDDLDPHRRGEWTAEQWARAEAAGLLKLAVPEPPAQPRPQSRPQPQADTAPAPQLSQHSPPPLSAMFGIDDAGLYDPGFGDSLVWWSEEHDDWRTRFPPPPGFRGDEEDFPDSVDYVRALSPAEAAAMGPGPYRRSAEMMERLALGRSQYFAHAAAAHGGAFDPPDRAEADDSLFAGDCPI